jgi:hypothetical protein
MQPYAGWLWGTLVIVLLIVILLAVTGHAKF